MNLVFFSSKKVAGAIRTAAKIPSAALRAGYFIFVKEKNEAGVIRHAHSKSKKIALTFDDGPGNNFTSEILRILKRYNVKATFFVVGKRAKKHPALCRQMLREGHEIGNHTYSHANLIAKTPGQISREIQRGGAAIFEATDKMPRYFRPPYGVYNRVVKRIAARAGYTFVLWNVRTFDSSITPRTKRSIIKKTKNLAKSGDIILLHDSKSILKSMMDRKVTVNALPEIIEDILSKGLKPVTLSELLKK
jgi:peptidoglycan/xylan/chitin deacetylase (PgdA/CDA1 family)